MKDIRGKLGTGAAWVAAARLLINAMSFISTLILAHFLFPGDFGLIAIATTISAIISAIMNLSVATALIQHQNPEEGHFHTAFTLNVGRSFVLATILGAAAPFIALIYHDDRLVTVMLMLALSAAIGGVSNPKVVVFSRNLVFRQDFLLNVSQKLVALIASLVIAVIWRNYWALLGGILAGQLTACGATYLLIPFRPKLSFSRFKDLWSFSIWLSLSETINTLNWRFDQLYIGSHLGSDVLGIYSVADNLAAVPTRESTQPIAQTLFPAFARMADDPDRLRSAYHTAQALVCAIALPAGVSFAILALPLVQVAMGDKWLPAVPVIQIIAVVFAFQTLASSAQPLALAVGVTKKLFQRDCITFAVRVPLIILGMTFYGLPGIVYARVISGILGTFLNLQLVRSILGSSVMEQLGYNRRALPSLALMAAAEILLKFIFGRTNNTYTLVVLIGVSFLVGTTVYLLTHFGLWLATGKPNGPETEVLRAAQTIFRRLRPRNDTILIPTPLG